MVCLVVHGAQDLATISPEWTLNFQATYDVLVVVCWQTKHEGLNISPRMVGLVVHGARDLAAISPAWSLNLQATHDALCATTPLPANPIFGRRKLADYSQETEYISRGSGSTWCQGSRLDICLEFN